MSYAYKEVAPARFLQTLSDSVSIALGLRSSSSECLLAARLDILTQFEDQYEQLVDCLSDAARFGPTERLEARYQALRSWMCDNYPIVREGLTAYLRMDEHTGMESVRSDSRTDTFTVLFDQPSLTAFLWSDDGAMIDRIVNTREALHLYGRHLRTLRVSY